MQPQVIALDQQRARELYNEYREHQHYATDIDREIQRTYRLIAQGRVVIRAFDSIRAAGLGPGGLPKLAIGRADKRDCFCEVERNGSVIFDGSMRFRQKASSVRLTLPPETFPGAAWKRGHATAPLIPLHLRPKQAIDAYHVLWEAEWSPVPPGDPMLLRRIGVADLWLVVAGWDLTEVERAALASRVHA